LAAAGEKIKPAGCRLAQAGRLMTNGWSVIFAGGHSRHPVHFMPGSQNSCNTEGSGEID